MADPVPIRPDVPIGVTSDAMRFCADALAEFISDNGADPATAVLILFDANQKPAIHFTGATAANLCLVGALLQQHAIEVVTSANSDPSAQP